MPRFFRQVGQQRAALRVQHRLLIFQPANGDFPHSG
jgi:hypothetical protein